MEAKGTGLALFVDETKTADLSPIYGVFTVSFELCFKMIYRPRPLGRGLRCAPRHRFGLAGARPSLGAR